MSGLYFFSEILDKNELIIYKNYGLTNIKIIGIISVTTFLIGIIVVFIFYNLSSNLKFLYLDIKNNYTKDNKYLAVVTSNGLWIKDEINNHINIINAEKIEDDYIYNIVISQFNKSYVFKKLIVADQANIKFNEWKISNPRITENNSTTAGLKEIIFEANFNKEKISTLFSNLSSLNLLELNRLKNDYEILGYSALKISLHQQKLYSYPFYLTIMVTIASILMLNIKYNKSKIFNLIIGILISVMIYYINYFLNVLSENNDLPYLISVWGSQFILILFISIGLVRINEK
tara:strand:- start:854 stop:1720 length:867 start_codon:yes stop_codon:yes gene_type:complete